MPATVRAKVAPKDKPIDTPAKGPPKNLTMLSKKTEIYFKISAATTISLFYSNIVKHTILIIVKQNYFGLILKVLGKETTFTKLVLFPDLQLITKRQISGIAEARHNVGALI